MLRWRPGQLLCPAVDVPAEAVRWLWRNHFAVGKIAVVAGPANVGESLLVAGDYAIRVFCCEVMAKLANMRN